MKDFAVTDGLKTYRDVKFGEIYALVNDKDKLECPLFQPSFVVGEGVWVRGLEQGLVGMTKFEPKTVEVKKFFPETHKHADKPVLLTVMVVDHQSSSELDESERLIVPEVIEEGNNVTFPEFSDKAVVHFTVKAAKTGEAIQSSYDDGEPTKLEIKLGDGVHEGIRLMSKGEKARLHIPMAKDCCFRGDFEGDVVVDVELLDIEPNADVTNFWNPGPDPLLELLKEHSRAMEKIRLDNSA